MKKRAFVVIALFAVIVLLIVSYQTEIKQLIYPREYEELVSKYSSEYGVPESLVYAVIYTESRFKPDARSSVGAIGLMQLMPDTLDWLSRLLDEPNPSGNIEDPETNIKYGTYYLKHLMDRFGSWETALAAYNAGHGRVTQWLKDERYSKDGSTLYNIPIEETKNYVNKVMSACDIYKEIYNDGEDQ